MSDDSLMDAAKVVGGATGGGGLIAAAMQLFRAREAREARDALIALQGSVERLLKDMDAMRAIHADVVRATDRASSAHARLDELTDRVERLERGDSPPATTRRDRRKG